MKCVLQIMLVSLIVAACSISAETVHAGINRTAEKSHCYRQCIIQESLIIKDNMNDLKSYVIAPQLAESKAVKCPARAEEKRNTVTISFTGTIDPSLRPTIRFYKSGDFYLTGEILDSENWTEDARTVTLSVPSAVYDIFVYWTELEPDVAHTRHCLVAKTQVSVDGDAKYVFDRADARNAVSFHHTLPNGDEPRWPGIKYDDTTGNPTRDWTNANVGMTHSIIHIVHPEFGFEIAHDSAFNAASDGNILDKFEPEEEMKLWCNDDITSDMWITNHIVMENEKGETYSSMASVPLNGGEKNVKVDNKGYCLVAEEFEHSPYFYQNDFNADISQHYVINEEVLGFPGFTFEYDVSDGDKRDIYIRTEPFYHENNNVTHTYVTQTSYDMAAEKPGPFGSVSLQMSGIKSPEIFNYGGAGCYMGSTWDDFTYHYIFRAPEGGYYKWPGILPRTNIHPVFSYEAGLRKQKLGNNVPVMSVLTIDYGVPEARIPISYPAIKGRYGESRIIDLEVLAASLSIGTEKIYEGSFDGMIDYMFTSYSDAPVGKVDIILTDNNVSVDGIPGKNVTEFGYDKIGDDVWAPTLQMLHFKDADGYVNDRFVNATDGVIEFAGGDFIEHFNDENYYWYTEEEAEVKVEYAPYGTNAFMPLDVTEIPELYFMPGYGHFYRGSLCGVDRGSSNGWFDIRISLKDAAGNYQRQTLSPAFKIESLAGVDTVTNNTGLIKVDGRNIIVPEGAKVFTVQGILSDGRNVQPGIYLVKTASATSKIIVR